MSEKRVVGNKGVILIFDDYVTKKQFVLFIYLFIEVPVFFKTSSLFTEIPEHWSTTTGLQTDEFYNRL